MTNNHPYELAHFRPRRHADRIEMGHCRFGESDVARFGLPERTQEEIFGFVGDGVKKLLPTGGGERKQDYSTRRCGYFVGTTWRIVWIERNSIPGLIGAETLFGQKQKAVATNKSIEYTNVILNGLGPEHFVYVIGGDNGFGLKPEPGMLLHVMEQLGVTKDRTVLVGDSTNDINGGHNAGIRVCAVGYGMGNRQKMAACQPGLVH